MWFCFLVVGNFPPQNWPLLSFQDPDDLPVLLRPDNANETARDAALATLIRELDLFDLANLEADPLEFVKQLQQELESEKKPATSE